MRIRYIVIRDLPRFTMFFRTISSKAWFSKKKKLLEKDVCFDFLHNFCLKHFSF